jgi:hypothetical protein
MDQDNENSPKSEEAMAVGTEPFVAKVNIELGGDGDEVEEEVHPLLAIMNGLKAKAVRTMGIKEEAIHVEIAAVNNAMVARVRHKGVLFNGEDWVAIVSITSRWETPDETDRSYVLAEVRWSRGPSEIWPRYEKIVKDAYDMGVFHKDIDPVISGANLRATMWKYAVAR